jgi:hypothetical protein
MCGLFIINRDEYRSEGSMFGFFGIVIMVLVVLSFKNAFLKFVKNKTLITVSLILLLFAYFMQYMGDNMILIATVSLFGAILQSGFESVAAVYERYSFKVVDGVRRLNYDAAIPEKQAWRESIGVLGIEEDEGNE